MHGRTSKSPTNRADVPWCVCTAVPPPLPKNAEFGKSKSAFRTVNRTPLRSPLQWDRDHRSRLSDRQTRYDRTLIPFPNNLFTPKFDLIDFIVNNAATLKGLLNSTIFSNPLSIMTVYGAHYAAQKPWTSALGSTTAISRQTYSGGVAVSPRAGADVYSPNKAVAACATYTMQRNVAGMSQPVKLQQSLQPNMSSVYRSTTLQNCPTCR